MVDETMSIGAHERAGGAVRRGLMGLALPGALAGCFSSGVTRLLSPEPLSALLADAEPRLGFAGFAGMGDVPMP